MDLIKVFDEMIKERKKDGKEEIINCLTGAGFKEVSYRVEEIEGLIEDFNKLTINELATIDIALLICETVLNKSFDMINEKLN